MLSILGKTDRRQRFCDGLSRRDMLRIGGTALGGLTLSQLLRLEAEAGTNNSHKSVIMIYMCGGPPHQALQALEDPLPPAPKTQRGPGVK